ncbi:UDP-3-O-acyl-N-acetylglucosamine deacetylase [Parachlamydia acanthamoebae]|uniref:UDP-3-O-acyl-N-acetylglucosamine deacetylase n=1 Tax=Parachlamydia acanthamoebae TaxID=83552 RepID=UPI0007509E88|nr:UDP-3-O-acyl-N-acetylglucosamine deacetylase [Parachlamydia acanthamoebae]
MNAFNSSLEKTCRRQRTLKKSVSFSGIGIHTGRGVSLKFCPAKEGTGIVFKRVDLPSQPLIPATVEYVCETNRSTTLGIGSVRIHTVEHVLAAIRAYEISNLCIEITSIEPPVGNGSSDVFVEMIEEAGIEEQDGIIPVVKIQEPVYWSEGDIHLVALPADEYRISYTLSYPTPSILQAQFHSLSVTAESFKNELAPCRTFSLYQEVSVLMDKGLIQGASLNNGVTIKDGAILSKGGLFFPNEMVRHKILDMIGDFSLVGFDFLAHVIAIRSGHASNFAFAKKLLHSITTERCS